ncbi:hypothetical protein [Aquabacterium humicola]|uniref:hypothetical protein n=1 Tax=Aquabacterium humicola TaxID=3237377 RepID=UPI002542A4EC|nr:hypothetical protein [Rubrivivax pictus]
MTSKVLETHSLVADSDSDQSELVATSDSSGPCGRCPFAHLAGKRKPGRPPKDTTTVTVVAAPEPSNSLIDGMQTLGSSELGQLIGRTQKSIKVDCFRRPHTLPPRFVIPGTRKMLWRVSDVKRWMDEIVRVQEEREREREELARRLGVSKDAIRMDAPPLKGRRRKR